MKITIIKFGGAVITSRRSGDAFDEENTGRLARELFPHRRNCVVIHGTGLVGKPPAQRHGYAKDGVISRRRRLLALRIRDDLRELNRRVVRTLLNASVPAMPYDASVWFGQSMDSLRDTGMARALLRALQNGIVPVFHGDLMPMRDGSFRVFSSDVIGLILAEALHPDTFVFLSDVEGVYAAAPGSDGVKKSNVLKTLGPDTVHRMYTSRADERDVSGGMSRKVACGITIARHCRRCVIGSGVLPGVLAKLLKGQPVTATRIVSGETGSRKAGR